MPFCSEGGTPLYVTPILWHPLQITYFTGFSGRFIFCGISDVSAGSAQPIWVGKKHPI